MLSLGLGRKIVSLGAGVFIALAAASIQPLVSQHEARADASAFLDGLCVGSELMAMEDLQLSRAGILKGSKVSVTKLLLRQGQIASVDVALADGHVVKKVAIGTIRTFFHVMNDRR